MVTHDVQPTLFDQPRIDQSFERFLLECPDIYPAFVRIAMDLRRRGHTRYSADGVCHIIRWEMITAGRDRDGWKVNNNYTAMLGRKAMAEFPELAGMFETRRIRRR